MADFGCTGTQKMLQQGFSETIRCVLDVFDHINCSDIIFAMVYKNFVKFEHCFWKVMLNIVVLVE